MSRSPKASNASGAKSRARRSAKPPRLPAEELQRRGERQEGPESQDQQLQPGGGRRRLAPPKELRRGGKRQGAQKSGDPQPNPGRGQRRAVVDHQPQRIVE